MRDTSLIFHPLPEFKGSVQIPYSICLFGGGAAGVSGDCDDGSEGNSGTQN